MTPNQKRNSAVLLLLAAAVLIYSLMGNSIGIHLDFGEDALNVSASDLDWSIPYSQISHMEIRDLPDVGSMTEGIDRKGLQCGIWHNALWDTYTLCISPRISRCIVLTMSDSSTFVFNYESEESTGSLYQMFAELLHSKGFTLPS